LTHVDELLGSFSFTAPEQLQSSADAGPAADLWSIGVLLHRMLTGEQPFMANDPGSVLAAILQRPPPRLVEYGVAPEIAAHLQPIIDRALQKRPGDRHPDADAMQRALVGACAALGAPMTSGSVRSQPAAQEFVEQRDPAPLADSEIADDAPTPLPEVHERAGSPSDRARSAANLGAPPKASRLPFALAALAGALFGWLTIPASAADPISAASADPSSVATVQLSVEPESAEVHLDGELLPRPERAAALAIEVNGPGRRVEIAAPGYVARTVELPVRGAAMLVRLERAAAAAAVGEPPPAISAGGAAAPPVGSAHATDADDLQIVREPPAVARPARPARSAATSRPARPDPTPNRPAQSAPAAGGAPPPIRTAPY
jgi:serine/threonine-protein kinase